MSPLCRLALRRTVLAVAMALVCSTSACVTTGTFDKKVAELDHVRADRDHVVSERDGLRKKLDDATALVGELTARLEKLGQNVGKLTSEKGDLARGLADAKVRLEEPRRQKAAAEARAATFRTLVARLKSMSDAGKLKVVIRDGRLLSALPNDVLFDSGRTDIRADGQAALADVAKVLATIPDRGFLVAGDTDDVPIHTARFPSNWELSTARAVEVTKFLISNGMRPQVLAAAGYGEFDPVVPNDSPERQGQNRRIEIRASTEPRRSTLARRDERDSVNEPQGNTRRLFQPSRGHWSKSSTTVAVTATTMDARRT